MQHFTDPRRRQALIIDDSLFKREFSRKTELLARVFDHDKQQYFKGFRTLTLGWSDGNTFLPLNFALMSSSHAKNLFGHLKSSDQRSLAAKRRTQATRKMTDVALELVDDAIKSGIKAKYVLFDSWYASPLMFAALLKRHCHGIGMLKKLKKSLFVIVAEKWILRLYTLTYGAVNGQLRIAIYTVQSSHLKLMAKKSQ